MDKSKSQNKPLVKETGWTVDDYYQLPEDGNQYELCAGQLELKPSPTTTHQRISHRLERLITDSCQNDYIVMHAPVDVILSGNETRQPDILMIHRDREYIIEEHAVVGPPDLVVEILSPNSVKRDRVDKKESYAKFGVPEYWIVDHHHQVIEQYVLKENGMPYTLQNVLEADDTVISEKCPCLSFVVKDGIRI
ncbi:Uma2 family endonuclease [Ornithinibacillus halophilus]|uniref:Endonuclease, Uma2 family (Restriction endonuclease fold) n=1 Tax=Ornithinibacillus halophilus TaxID=930117 RepID=A0A1M5JUC9_9BACI|nr:Uma2 family endonuclease [Ornithinibacillus halophilus]SHG44164.1 Endonuclease, Uma2 family (restriction endonuclease fold) [Ornithinibacillus halophilus]